MWSFAISLVIFQLYVIHCTTAHQFKAFPKSCLDHLKSGAEKNGYYTVTAQDGGTLTVYCDFQSEPGSAWTLVTSWSQGYKNLPPFKTASLTENAPVNEKSPNWVAYRLSKNTMAAIKSHSSHWRATCYMNQYTFSYRDYVRGKINDFDIMTYLGGGQCKKVEYINIRGHVGYQTTVPFWQMKDVSILHIDSSYKTCTFGGTPDAAQSEDNFGYYLDTNTNFACTADPNATTQYWFGGYL